MSDFENIYAERESISSEAIEIIDAAFAEFGTLLNFSVGMLSTEDVGSGLYLFVHKFIIPEKRYGEHPAIEGIFSVEKYKGERVLLASRTRG